MNPWLILWIAVGLPSPVMMAWQLWSTRREPDFFEGAPILQFVQDILAFTGCAMIVAVLSFAGPINWIAQFAAIARHGEGRFNMWTGKMRK